MTVSAAVAAEWWGGATTLAELHRRACSKLCGAQGAVVGPEVSTSAVKMGLG